MIVYTLEMHIYPLDQQSHSRIYLKGILAKNSEQGEQISSLQHYLCNWKAKNHPSVHQ